MVDDENPLTRVGASHETRTRTIDGDGLRWNVREEPWPMADRRHGSCLIFDSEAIVRRVRTVPPGWYDRSDADLYALSLGR